MQQGGRVARQDAPAENEFSARVVSSLPALARPVDEELVTLALADTVCCAFAAEALADERPIALARVRGAMAAGGDGAASVWWDGSRLAPEDATLRNATAARMLDSNDTYVGRVITHPSDMIAALVALAETRSVAWQRLVASIGIAYEVLGRLADSADLPARGLDPSTLTPLGVVAGAAWLLDLPPERAAAAFRIAALDAATSVSVRQGRLSDWKAIASGRGAAKALFAVRMAEAGCLAPDQVFEGPNGVFARVTGPLDLATDDEPRMARLLFKEYPAQIFIQGLIGLAAKARPMIGTRRIHRASVETFRLAVSMVGGHAAHGKALNRESADHSAPFCIASILRHGRLTHEDYERFIADPDVGDLTTRIALVEDAAATAAYPQQFRARIVFDLEDGTRAAVEQERPERMTRQAMAAKFDGLWPKGKPRAWPWRLPGEAPAFPVP